MPFWIIFSIVVWMIGMPIAYYIAKECNKIDEDAAAGLYAFVWPIIVAVAAGVVAVSLPILGICHLPKGMYWVVQKVINRDINKAYFVAKT